MIRECQCYYSFMFFSIDLTNFAYARHFKFLKEQEIMLPSESVAVAYSDLVDPIHNLLRLFKEKNNNLCQTRDLLLPKLISGELDVFDLDIFIPEEAA